jgi:hypothetical protein
MSYHTGFALDHPVFDPVHEILAGHFWFYNRRVHAGLTANIGME